MSDLKIDRKHWKWIVKCKFHCTSWKKEERLRNVQKWKPRVRSVWNYRFSFLNRQICDNCRRDCRDCLSFQLKAHDGPINFIKSSAKFQESKRFGETRRYCRTSNSQKNKSVHFVKTIKSKVKFKFWFNETNPVIKSVIHTVDLSRTQAFPLERTTN